MSLKPDADAIRRVLAKRDGELKLGPHQWWTKFAFHFTDVLNAVGILTEESLYCRATAVERDLMRVENAARTVIARSRERTDHLARLYFRPRTPTQYNNEGCRPEGQRSHLEAHCPVPVFFMFDLEALLIQRGTRFSNGWPVSPTALIGDDAAFLKGMEWGQIYGSGSVPRERIGDMKFYRMAEVLIPDGLSLEHLKHIVCRSAPERDTLLHLLPESVRGKWRSKVRPLGRADLFELHWTFIESVKWVDNTILLTLAPGSWTPGPFTVTTTVTDVRTRRVLIDHQETSRTFRPNENRFRITLRSPVTLVHVELRLDGCLVYSALVQKEGLLTG